MRRKKTPEAGDIYRYSLLPKCFVTVIHTCGKLIWIVSHDDERVCNWHINSFKREWVFVRRNETT